MLKSNLNLCHYRDSYILVKENITVANTGKEVASENRRKNLTFKNYAPFTDCISKINNRKIDNTEVIDVVMLIYS